jgi:WD40 repeat protein
VWSCAFSPDGTTFTVGLDDGDIIVYSTTGSEMILSDHEVAVRGLAYSPDGKLIVSGSHDKTVRIWYMESGICQHILTDHTDKVLCVAYSPHGNQVTSAGDDETIRLWDPATGHCCRILSGHKDAVVCVVYSPNGERIASSIAQYGFGML